LKKLDEEKDIKEKQRVNRKVKNLQEKLEFKTYLKIQKEGLIDVKPLVLKK